MTVAREEARQRLLRSMLYSTGKKVYESFDMILVGQSVLHPMGHSITTSEDSWFFLIDDVPMANWEHPCKYVLVGQRTGAITVVNESAPPLNITLRDVTPVSDSRTNE
jgi:hypothetical protein